ncbi:MAG: hypothetical protein AAGE01_14390 [Pseudomonadota bacterium]
MQKTPHLRKAGLYGLSWALSFIVWLWLYFASEGNPAVLLAIVVPVLMLALSLRALLTHLRVTAPPRKDAE